ncbi:hypothetical protein CRI94_04785 [Longibacter salinarum]|uniref:Uncharacterized protein n=1 Tax=Longibacter salinarum TaxID=1850348 RepID=A0A2A8D0E0_9BACT|nr:hypothetical protein [Longibacter salinarum]PEN14354.1 hypothetical protein CRI94_04785 [Longibacter salinarum]
MSHSLSDKRFSLMRSTLHFIALALSGMALLWCSAPVVYGQTGPTLTSQQPPIRIAVEPAYQSVTHQGRELSQFSTRLMASVPLLRNLQAYVRASVAQSDANGLESVQGLDDVRLGASYARALSLGSLVMAADLSIPTGKRNLSAVEWRTSILASQNIYGFRVGGFGQGFNAEPRLTWAVPVRENVMLGIGAGYTYRGPYEPTEALQGAYDPGNEVEVFGGADVRVGQHHAISTDLSYTRFGSDTVEGEKRYEARYKLAGTVQYLFQRDFTTVRVVGQLQHWPESRIFVPNLGFGAEPIFEDNQVVPSEWLLRARGSSRVVEWMDLGVTLTGQRFEETVVQEEAVVGAVEVAPTFHLPGDVYLTPGVGYAIGDVERFEARIRTEVRL